MSAAGSPMNGGGASGRNISAADGKRKTRRNLHSNGSASNLTDRGLSDGCSAKLYTHRRLMTEVIADRAAAFNGQAPLCLRCRVRIGIRPQTHADGLIACPFRL